MFINQKPFPTCKIKSKTNKGYESNKEFICIIASDRFENELSIKICTPYREKVKDEKGILTDFYSWQSECGEIISHYRDGHGDHESVIDWIPLNDNSSEAVMFREYFKKQSEYATSRKNGDFY